MLNIISNHGNTNEDNMSYHLRPTRLALIKKQELVRIWRNWTLIADGNVKCKISVTLENNLAILQNAKYRVIL